MKKPEIKSRPNHIKKTRTSGKAFAAEKAQRTWPVFCLDSSDSDFQLAVLVFQSSHFHHSLQEFPISAVHIPAAVVVVSRRGEPIAEKPCYPMKYIKYTLSEHFIGYFFDLLSLLLLYYMRHYVFRDALLHTTVVMRGHLRHCIYISSKHLIYSTQKKH